MDSSPLPQQAKSAPAASEGAGWIAFIFNAYLFCFTASGLLFLANQAVGAAFPGFFGNIASLLALVVILIGSSYRHLPWRCLWPALAFSIWDGCLLVPLPALVPLDALSWASGLIKIGIGLGTCVAIRKSSASNAFFFQKTDFFEAKFSLQRSLGLGAVKLLLLTPALLLYLAWSAQFMLNKASKGFLQIDTTGLYTVARTYECEGRTIYLLPTVHIASPDFYQTLMENLPTDETVILPEGVTDKKHLMRAKADYSQVADSVGLKPQPNLGQTSKRADIAHYDADISDFKPSTVHILNSIFGALEGATGRNMFSVLESMRELQALESSGELDTKAIMEDILYARNARVIKGISSTLQTYHHIAVPWGAAHMAGIEEGVLKMRAVLKESRRIKVLAWKDIKLPFAE